MREVSRDLIQGVAGGGACGALGGRSARSRSAQRNVRNSCIARWDTRHIHGAGPDWNLDCTLRGSFYVMRILNPQSRQSTVHSPQRNVPGIQVILIDSDIERSMSPWLLVLLAASVTKHNPQSWSLGLARETEIDPRRAGRGRGTGLINY